jgi:hypothetical protein
MRCQAMILLLCRFPGAWNQCMGPATTILIPVGTARLESPIKGLDPACRVSDARIHITGRTTSRLGDAVAVEPDRCQACRRV